MTNSPMSRSEESLRASAPTWTQGAWRRAGRSIDGGPSVEPSDVLWLQVGTHFADLRLPRDGGAVSDVYDRPQAFSGVLHVDEAADSPIALWIHDLDTITDRAGVVDRATLRPLPTAMQPEALDEEGPGYQESWQKVSVDPHASDVVLERRDSPNVLTARIVSTSGLAIAVWAGDHPGGEWLDLTDPNSGVRQVGDDDHRFSLDDALATIRTGGHLPRGWRRVERE